MSLGEALEDLAVALNAPAQDRAVVQIDEDKTSLRLRLRHTGPPWNVPWGPLAGMPPLAEALDQLLADRGWARLGEWEPMFAAPRDVPMGTVVGAYHCEVEAVAGGE